MACSYFLSYVVLERIATFQLGERHCKFRPLGTTACQETFATLKDG